MSEDAPTELEQQMKEFVAWKKAQKPKPQPPSPPVHAHEHHPTTPDQSIEELLKAALHKLKILAQKNMWAMRGAAHVMEALNWVTTKQRW